MQKLLIILSLLSAVNIAAQDNKRKAEQSQDEPTAKRQKLDENLQSNQMVQANIPITLNNLNGLVAAVRLLNQITPMANQNNVLVNGNLSSFKAQLDDAINKQNKITEELFLDIAKPGMESIKLGATIPSKPFYLPSGFDSNSMNFLAFSPNQDLFIARDNTRKSLMFFDYKDKNNPIITNEIPLKNHNIGEAKFTKCGNFVYLNCYNNEGIVFHYSMLMNISNWKAITAERCEFNIISMDFASNGNFAFISFEEDGSDGDKIFKLGVLDTSDHKHPKLIWSEEYEDYFDTNPDTDIVDAISISKCDKYVYLLSDSCVMCVYDISDIKNPKSLKFRVPHASPFNSDGYPCFSDISADGKKMLTSNGTVQFFWDISKPESPKKLRKISEDNSSINMYFEFSKCGKYIFNPTTGICCSLEDYSEIQNDNLKGELSSCGNYSINLPESKISLPCKSWIFNDFNGQQKNFILNLAASFDNDNGNGEFKKFIHENKNALNLFNDVFKKYLIRYFAIKELKKRYMVSDVANMVGQYLGCHDISENDFSYLPDQYDEARWYPDLDTNFEDNKYGYHDSDDEELFNHYKKHGCWRYFKQVK